MKRLINKFLYQALNVAGLTAGIYAYMRSDDMRVGLALLLVIAALIVATVYRHKMY